MTDHKASPASRIFIFTLLALGGSLPALAGEGSGDIPVARLARIASGIEYSVNVREFPRDSGTPGPDHPGDDWPNSRVARTFATLPYAKQELCFTRRLAPDACLVYFGVISRNKLRIPPELRWAPRGGPSAHAGEVAHAILRQVASPTQRDCIERQYRAMVNFMREPRLPTVVRSVVSSHVVIDLTDNSGGGPQNDQKLDRGPVVLDNPFFTLDVALNSRGECLFSDQRALDERFKGWDGGVNPPAEGETFGPPQPSAIAEDPGSDRNAGFGMPSREGRPCCTGAEGLPQ